MIVVVLFEDGTNESEARKISWAGRATTRHNAAALFK
jgi:hypothetical protein